MTLFGQKIRGTPSVFCLAQMTLNQRFKHRLLRIIQSYYIQNNEGVRLTSHQKQISTSTSVGNECPLESVVGRIFQMFEVLRTPGESENKKILSAIDSREF